MDECDADGPVITGLLTKRDEVEHAIASLERQVRVRRGDLAHIDAVLRMFSPDLAQARQRASVFARSVYFQSGEITRRCQDALRESGDGFVTTEAIVMRAMRDKRLDPADRRLRDDFARRFTWALNVMLAAGKVRKIGGGMQARWSLPEG
jgi:hypothetical protein